MELPPSPDVKKKNNNSEIEAIGTLRYPLPPFFMPPPLPQLSKTMLRDLFILITLEIFYWLFLPEISDTKIFFWYQILSLILETQIKRRLILGLRLE